MSDEKEKMKIRTMNMINGDLTKWMEEKVDKLLNSGAINFEDDLGGPMLWPKVILCAIAEEMRFQYGAKGTSFARRINKEVNNLKHFI